MYPLVVVNCAMVPVLLLGIIYVGNIEDSFGESQHWPLMDLLTEKLFSFVLYFEGAICMLELCPMSSLPSGTYVRVQVEM